jgi:cephalosporin-C deacetylase-like acetyl esterase
MEAGVWFALLAADWNSYQPHPIPMNLRVPTLTVSSSYFAAAICGLCLGGLNLDAQTTPSPSAPAPLPASPPRSELEVFPDTGFADARYKRGETVKFRVWLRPGAEVSPAAKVEWTLSKDGVAPTTQGTGELQDGMLTISGRLDEPGFLQCRVKLQGAGASGVAVLGGAAVEPEKIQPSLPAPADFDAYWTSQKERLAAVPMNARLTAVEPAGKASEVFDLQADSVGAPVSGYFARPKGAAPRSLPAILTVHGAGVRSSSRGSAESWASQGLLALDINAHGLPNGKTEEFYKTLADGDLKDYRIRGRDSRDTIYFHGMFLRLVRAIDFLTAQPEWDGRTVIVSGSSQGGAQALVAAGLDSRVTFFAAGVPAMCDHTGFKADRINGWPKFITTGEQPPDSVTEAVRYYDAVNFAKRTKASGIVTVGFIDTTCPPTGGYAAFNAVKGEKLMVEEPLSGHGVPQRSSDAMRAAILKHVSDAKGTK